MRNKKLKKMMSITAAVLIAGVLSGCSVKFGTNKEPDPDTVVAYATSGEGHEDMKVTYEMFKKEYKYFLETSEVTDDTAEDVADYCTSQRQSIINYLTNEQIIIKKAKEMGVYDLTEEELAEVEQGLETQIAEYVGYFGSPTDASQQLTDDEMVEIGTKKFEEMLERCGMTRDDLRWWEQSSKITEKLIAVLGEDVPYSGVEEELDKLRQTAKEIYNTDIMQYLYGGYNNVWVPEDSRMIKHVLVGFDSSIATEISEMRADGSNEEAEKKRAEAAEGIKEKVEEIEKKLADGEDIDELIKQYSADAEGSKMYPDGYMVFRDDPRYVKEFSEAAFVPQKIGDRTTCVSDYGVHIMVYAGNAKISAETEKANADTIMESLKQKEFSNKIAEWREEYAFEIDYGALRLEKPSEGSSAAA